MFIMRLKYVLWLQTELYGEEGEQSGSSIVKVADAWFLETLEDNLLLLLLYISAFNFLTTWMQRTMERSAQPSGSAVSVLPGTVFNTDSNRNQSQPLVRSHVHSVITQSHQLWTPFAEKSLEVWLLLIWWSNTNSGLLHQTALTILLL